MEADAAVWPNAEAWFSLRMARSEPCSVFERANGDFLEDNRRVARMVLQADVTCIRAAAAVRLALVALRSHRLTFNVIGDLGAVELHHGMRSVDGDQHRVPLAGRSLSSRHSLCLRVDHACAVIIVAG